MKVFLQSTLALALVLFISVSSQAQVVKDVHYSILLENTLKHTVPAVNIADVNPNDNSLVFLDAREKAEFKVSHIKDALWVGHNDFKLKRLKDTPKDAQIIVYCSIGARSEAICEQLIQAGYINAINLYGGIFEWVNQDNKVFKGENETTKIHAYSPAWSQWLMKGEKVY